VRHVSVGALPATALAGGSNLALIPLSAINYLIFSCSRLTFSVFGVEGCGAAPSSQGLHCG
jgi:hypothetical protein